MEISIIEEKKLVEIWLTHAESQDETVRENLKPLYAEYKEKKYTTAVFLSGTRNLADASSDLLCYNRRRIAQLEVQKEKESPAAI
ncbi:MAG: hypothetical protein GX025_08445 [Clostridiales bacterium]|nr:hypothetical protein [Clostridiales bacterium]